MTTTTKDLIEEVKKIASEDPDFIYTAKHCSYFGQEVGDPTGQCCIVGQAFKNLNIDTFGIEENGKPLYKGSGKTTSPNISMVIQRGMVNIEVDSELDIIWLSKVQSVQDRNKPWGEAIASANDYVGVY